jgi:hypothetical protein
MVTTTPNTIQNTNADSTFNLPTDKVDNVIDKTVNTINNLSTPNKIIAGSITGVVFLGLAGLVAYCCYRCRNRRRYGRGRRMQISYPLAPLSPTLRRRR